jgi:MraZ protein
VGESGKKWVIVVKNAGSVRRSGYLGDVELMFLSQYEHAIDEKGRLTIPNRFRELLNDGAYITQGFDQNLNIYTAASFDQIYQRVSQLSITDPAARDLRRLIFSHAERVEFDRAGRILIPQFLRSAALLKDMAMVVGAGAYIEIWSPELWNEKEQKSQEPAFKESRFAALEVAIV